MQLATSLALSGVAVGLFATLWLMSWWIGDCPSWFRTVGVSCDVVVGLTFFAICPTLGLLAIIFAIRDVRHKERRTQGYLALCLAAALLTWYWAYPPR